VAVAVSAKATIEKMKGHRNCEKKSKEDGVVETTKTYMLRLDR
jgi:hypothetical protein